MELFGMELGEIITPGFVIIWLVGALMVGYMMWSVKDILGPFGIVFVIGAEIVWPIMAYILTRMVFKD